MEKPCSSKNIDTDQINTGGVLHVDAKYTGLIGRLIQSHHWKYGHHLEEKILILKHS